MRELAIPQLTQRRFPISVEMYHTMAEKGAFEPTDRVELIGGEIYEMSPIGARHARCVKFLANFLISLFGGKYVISIQDPIVLDDDSEPQPDIAILRYQQDFYKDALPEAADVAVIIEVADTSVEFDRLLKLPKYATAGIPEFWLVDLVNDRVEVHTEPKEGTYGIVKIYQRGENAVSETLTSLDLPVDDILG